MDGTNPLGKALHGLGTIGLIYLLATVLLVAAHLHKAHGRVVAPTEFGSHATVVFSRTAGWGTEWWQAGRTTFMELFGNVDGLRLEFTRGGVPTLASLDEVLALPGRLQDAFLHPLRQVNAALDV